MSAYPATSDRQSNSTRQRRDHILATARLMITDLGFDQVTVRALAERCGISVPTLYNQFGDKDGVLAAAVEGHFIEVMTDLADADLPPGYARLTAIIDRIADQMQTESRFHKRLLAAFASLNSTSAVQHTIATRLTDALNSELQHMQAQQNLVAWIDLHLLAAQITSACIGTAIVWGSGLIPTTRLRAAMQYSTGLVLLGLTSRDCTAALVARLQAAQRQLQKR